nr:unnamed protein product [Digitaria exilis]
MASPTTLPPRKREAALGSMDSGLEEATQKLAWLSFACARDDLESGVALLAELKLLRVVFYCTDFVVVHAVVFARSPYEYQFLGLNLLRLLPENRISEFHTELEHLPLEALNHPCIKYAVELEQSFMEGTYKQLANFCQAVPNETYVYLMDRIAESVRDEIVDCSVEAYDYLPVSVAKKMLMFTSYREFFEYISEVHLFLKESSAFEQPEWEIKNCSIHFHMAKPKSHMDLSSFKLIKQALSYAQELEQIV